MQNKSIDEINEIYDLELDKIIKKIKTQKAKRVLLQFPDGMKPYATTIVEYLEEQKELKGVEFFIWFGSCYGACDVPNVDFADLIVQFGHTEWKFKNEKIKII